MATEIRVPTLGESVTEATIGKWFKKVGDAIAADEPLVELETDKVTIEVPAAAAGVLAEIVAQEGDTVEVNALLGQISGAGSAPAPKRKKPSQPQSQHLLHRHRLLQHRRVRQCSQHRLLPSFAEKAFRLIRSMVRASAVRSSRAMFSTQSLRAFRLLQRRLLLLLHVRLRRLTMHRAKNA